MAPRPWGPHPMCVMKSFLKKKKMDAPTVNLLAMQKGKWISGEDRISFCLWGCGVWEPEF